MSGVYVSACMSVSECKRECECVCVSVSECVCECEWVGVQLSERVRHQIRHADKVGFGAWVRVDAMWVGGVLSPRAWRGAYERGGHDVDCGTDARYGWCRRRRWQWVWGRSCVTRI